MYSLLNYRYMQYVSVLVATLLHGSISVLGGWLSPVLPQLTSPGSPLGVTFTPNQESWLVAAEYLGSPIGAIIAAPLSNTIGRKLTLLIAVIPILLTFIISAFVKIPIVLITFRAIAGIGVGFNNAITPVYIGEVAEKDIRGKLGVIETLLIVLGRLYALSLGPFLDYFSFTLSCCAFPAAFLCLFMFMPESPYHLVKIGKTKDAAHNLKRLSYGYASSTFIESRLHEVELSVKRDTENSKGFWDLFKYRKNLKALFLSLAIRLILILSGIFVIQSYLQSLIEKTNSAISSELSSIIFGVIQLPAVFLAAFCVDRIGRKPLLVISATGGAIALIAEGIYFYFQDVLNADVSSISWLPTVGLSFYLLFVCFGILVLPGVTTSELFSIDIKSYGASFTALFASVVSFAVSMSFKPISTLWGVHVILWIFACMCLISSLFGLLFLPETKGKSFIELQEMLEARQVLHLPKCNK